MTPDLATLTGCRKAIQIAKDNDEALALIYARLLYANLKGQGVNLSPEDVSSLVGDGERMERIVTEILADHD